MTIKNIINNYISHNNLDVDYVILNNQKIFNVKDNQFVDIKEKDEDTLFILINNITNNNNINYLNIKLNKKNKTSIFLNKQKLDNFYFVFENNFIYIISLNLLEENDLTIVTQKTLAEKSQYKNNTDIVTISRKILLDRDYNVLQFLNNFYNNKENKELLKLYHNNGFPVYEFIENNLYNEIKKDLRVGYNGYITNYFTSFLDILELFKNNIDKITINKTLFLNLFYYSIFHGSKKCISMDMNTFLDFYGEKQKFDYVDLIFVNLSTFQYIDIDKEYKELTNNKNLDKLISFTKKIEKYIDNSKNKTVLYNTTNNFSSFIQIMNYITLYDNALKLKDLNNLSKDDEILKESTLAEVKLIQKLIDHNFFQDIYNLDETLDHLSLLANNNDVNNYISFIDMYIDFIDDYSHIYKDKTSSYFFNSINYIIKQFIDQDYNYSYERKTFNSKEITLLKKLLKNKNLLNIGINIKDLEKINIDVNIDSFIYGIQKYDLEFLNKYLENTKLNI